MNLRTSVHDAGRAQSEAKGPDAELVLATGDAKGGLVHVTLADAELVVGRGQIKLGEETGPTGLIN